MSSNKKQFWKLQPLDVNCFKEPELVYDRESLLLKIENNHIEANEGHF